MLNATLPLHRAALAVTASLSLAAVLLAPSVSAAPKRPREANAERTTPATDCAIDPTRPAGAASCQGRRNQPADAEFFIDVNRGGGGGGM